MTPATGEQAGSCSRFRLGQFTSFRSNGTISGPNTYQGSVEFGDAQSVEWVVGGILAAHGYTLSVTATDAEGDPCKGTSPMFDVVPGASTYTMITITCDVASPDQADVTTGSVAIEAGVVAASD